MSIFLIILILTLIGLATYSILVCFLKVLNCRNAVLKIDWRKSWEQILKMNFPGQHPGIRYSTPVNDITIINIMHTGEVGITRLIGLPASATC